MAWGCPWCGVRQPFLRSDPLSECMYGSGGDNDRLRRRGPATEDRCRVSVALPQLGCWRELADLQQELLGRGLRFPLIHRCSPSGGRSAAETQTRGIARRFSKFSVSVLLIPAVVCPRLIVRHHALGL